MKKKKKDTSAQSFSEAIGVKDALHNERATFILGLILLVAAVYMLISFFSYFNTAAADQSLLENPRTDDVLNESRVFRNYCGSIGAYISYFFIKRCFGLAAIIIPCYLILAGLRLLGAYKMNLWKWFLGCAIVMIWCSIVMAKFLAPLFADSTYNPGGDHGLFICQYIENFIGSPGLIAILAIVLIIVLSFITNETITVVRKILNPKGFIQKIPFTILNKNTDEENEPLPNDEKEEESYESDSQPVNVTFSNIQQDSNPDKKKEEVGSNKKVSDEKSSDDVQMKVDTGAQEETADSKVLVGNAMLEKYDPRRDLSHYKFPTLDLLKRYDDAGKPVIDMDEQNKNKNRIVEVLKSFGVEIRDIFATVGPTITLYEVVPAEGVRISKIKNLEDDIALSLAAIGIRIIAPMPGKGTIGIEVPNAKPQVVSMESILNSRKFQTTTMKLPIALGKTISNEVFMVDLAKIPHLLVAGATGQGKSVGLNAIITSLLYKKHPAEMKLVLIDPKKVEFSIYRSLDKHFLAALPEEDEPIITDVTKVVRTLNSLCKEMDTRYDLLKKAGARKLEEYNEKFVSRQLNPENGHRYLPYIVVIIDEFGDLIMTAGKEIELPIARIAQLARAVGIHMVIATQRPTTTIITGNIKANFPGRMAFKVSSMMDSRIILDRPGANQLVGRGDMLFLSGNDPVRVQCAFVDTPEVERINNYISEQQGYTSTYELPEPDTQDEAMGGGGEGLDSHNLDNLFADAARLIVLSQQGSTSLIQRKFAIGYNRAGRLMDQLEKAGIVGAAQGSKPREVLITDENSLNTLLNSLNG